MGNGFARTAKTTLGHLLELGNRRSQRRESRGGSLLVVELRASGLRLLLMRAIRKVRGLVDLVDDFRLIVWFSQRLKRRDHDSDSDQWEIFLFVKVMDCTCLSSL